MDPKVHLLSFLMMDIYARVVLQGGPSSITELERAMDFCEQAEGLMKKRGWLEPPALNAKARPIETHPDHAKAFPGLRKYVLEHPAETVVLSQSPTEHPLPVSDASGAA